MRQAITKDFPIFFPNRRSLFGTIEWQITLIDIYRKRTENFPRQ